MILNFKQRDIKENGAGKMVKNKKTPYLHSKNSFYP